MLFSDGGSGRAGTLAEELGGEVGSNAEIAERADFVVVAVKPAKLDEVAPELRAAKKIVSILAAVPLTRLREAFPGGGSAAGDAERGGRGAQRCDVRRRRGRD